MPLSGPAQANRAFLATTVGGAVLGDCILLEKLRQQLEEDGRGQSRWDDVHRLNGGDRSSIGKLIAAGQQGVCFSAQIVYDALEDDVMSPKLIANPTLRATLADQRNWREPALKPKLAQIGEPGTVITDTTMMLKNVSNAYAHLFRMRRTNIAAQRMMLEAFPIAPCESATRRPHCVRSSGRVV